MANKRILIVEDESILALGIQSKLESFGYDVPDPVSSGEEAIQRAEEIMPDLVLMDVILRDDMNGIEAAEEIRKRFGIPVIYLTAHSDEKTLARAKVTEPFGYILKPFDERELHSTIEMALYKYKMERKLKENEEWLFTTLRSIGDAVIATDLKGCVTLMNPIAEKLTGWGQEEARGKGLVEVFNIVNEQTHKPAENPLKKTLEEGVVANLANNTVLVARDGTEIPIDDSAAPIKDDKGNIVGVVMVFRDITKRRRAEAKLAEMFGEIEKSRDDMLTILNQLRLGTAQMDKDGCVTFLSRVAERLLGKKQVEVLGKQWEQVFPFKGEDKARLKAMYEHLPEQRTKASAHVETAGGQHYWMEIEIQDNPHDSQRKIFVFYDVSEVHDLRRLLDEKAQFHDLVGKSKPMQLVYQQIRDLAEVDSIVLIEGETGTGKELVARAVHFSSRRKDKPFIPVNCAGLTESLLGSQLFGHKRGAFTGAISDHKGVFEAANGGTIFLDEIGDIPMNVQTSLLRVLQEREITRLGESEPRKIDLRVIVATQHDLSEEVEKGRFRADLLYRIRVARIQLPPLTERREDIPLLVGYFLGQARAATGKSYVEDISSEAMDVLLDYHWPGNLRELKNVIEFAVIRCKGSVIQVEDVPPEILDLNYSHSLSGSDEQDERQSLLDALERARGNRTFAARLLGIGRTTLYRRLAELGVKFDK